MAASFITSQGGGRRSEVGSRKYLCSEFLGLYPTFYKTGGATWSESTFTSDFRLSHFRFL